MSTKRDKTGKFIKGHKPPKLWRAKHRQFMSGKKCSVETKKKMSLAKKGKMPKNIKQFAGWNKGKHGFNGGSKHYNWKGGLTNISLIIRHSLKYKEWRTKVFKRDNYVCLMCSKKGGYLEADHIIWFSKIINKLVNRYGIKNLFQRAMKSRMLWSIKNGRTLCLPCHKTTFIWLE